MSKIFVFLSSMEIISKYSIIVEIFMDTQLDNELSTSTHRKNGSTNLLMLLQVVTREPLIVLFYENNYSVPKGKLTQ